MHWTTPTTGTQYKTTRPVDWEVGKKGSGLYITVPAGFVFESSVPRALWWLFNPHDPRYLWAACVHDWLLETGYRKAFAAGEWYDGARAYHAPKWRTIWAYVAVSLWTLRR